MKNNTVLLDYLINNNEVLKTGHVSHFGLENVQAFVQEVRYNLLSDWHKYIRPNENIFSLKVVRWFPNIINFVYKSLVVIFDIFKGIIFFNGMGGYIISIVIHFIFHSLV